MSDHIFDDVLEAMQQAEEMGGPEGPDYLILMRRIRDEAQKRFDTYASDGLLFAMVEEMKREITWDISDGYVPDTVASFSEIHDYRDANYYGGFCEDKFADAMIEAFGGRDEHEGMPQGMVDFINSAQDQIDQWLTGGRK